MGYVTGGGTSGGSGGAPSGAASGELAGTYPGPTVADGVIDDANIVAGGLTNAALASAAAIANTKLATNPLARANHTGTQAMATISDAGTLATKSAVASADITDGTIVGGDLSSTIALPSGATASTQSVGDSSTKLATTAFTAANAAGLAGTVGGPPKMIRRTSDGGNITSNTSLASDSQLTFAVTTSSDVWFVEAFLVLSGANTTHDFKVAFAMPTSWTGYWGALSVLNTTTNGWGPNTAATTPIAFIAPGTAIAGASISGNWPASYAAICVGDGANTGSIALQIAQNTSDLGALAIKANSFLRATRIA